MIQPTRHLIEQVSGPSGSASLKKLPPRNGLPGVRRQLCHVRRVRRLDQWAYLHDVKLDFSRRGKPTDNAMIEAFNARLRRNA